MRSPDTAKHVRELRFYGKGYHERIDNPERKLRPTQKKVPQYIFEAKPKVDKSITGSKPLLEKAMRGMRLSDKERKSVLGRDSDLDFIIAIIIVHCPNLRLLHLGVDLLHENTFLPKVCYHYFGLEAGASISVLMKLEGVHLAQDIRYGSSYDKSEPLTLSLSLCLPFFYVPSLETLSAPLPDSIGYHRPPLPHTEWPTSTPPISIVRTLDLHNTRAKPATLAFLLAQTPHLRSLRYNHWCDYMDQEKLDCAQLRNALHSVSSTLAELTISLDPFSNEAAATDEINTWVVDQRGIGSLAFLPHLTKLEIALPILIDWSGESGLSLEDVLPSTLEVLCLRDDCVNYHCMIWAEEPTIGLVRRWLENKAWKKHTPSMKRFGLRLIHSSSDEWGTQARNALKYICKSEGLEFWFEKQHLEYER